jgi:hypothetical protein
VNAQDPTDWPILRKRLESVDGAATHDGGEAIQLEDGLPTTRAVPISGNSFLQIVSNSSGLLATRAKPTLRRTLARRLPSSPGRHAWEHRSLEFPGAPPAQ